MYNNKYSISDEITEIVYRFIIDCIVRYILYFENSKKILNDLKKKSSIARKLEYVKYICKLSKVTYDFDILTYGLYLSIMSIKDDCKTLIYDYVYDHISSNIYIINGKETIGSISLLNNQYDYITKHIDEEKLNYLLNEYINNL